MEREGVIRRPAALGRLVVAVIMAVIVVPPVAAAVAVATLLEAPLPGSLPAERPAPEAVPSRVFDRDGNEIAVFRGFDRTSRVEPGDIPAVVRDAVVAIEDQRFWDHNGVDLVGIMRAARVNLEVGDIAQGGSTITQQYVKNTYLSGEQTFERKAREAMLALELERTMTKDEILFAYLETSYFGAGAYGVGAAAEVYFDKSVTELDLSEAATLAGVLQSPSRLSPREDIEAADARRRLVLQAMLDMGAITEAEYQRHAPRTLWPATSGAPPGGLATLVAPPPPKGASAHPFFVDWVEATLLRELGPDRLYRGGLEIRTTIDPRLQAAAEQAVAERLTGTVFPVEMSLVSVDPRTGEVLAMVGGRDYDFSQVNLATGGSTGFQSGSAFKPIVLAAAFTQGINPESVRPAPGRWSVPNCDGSHCVIANYDGADRGEQTLREAMWSSTNTVFAMLIDEVSITSTVELASALGLSRLDPGADYGHSLALGTAETSPLEMASAYATFANRGIHHRPIGVLQVLDGAGNMVIDHAGRVGTRVLDTNVADTISEVLTGVVTEGTGAAAAVSGHPIAGKTGTSQSYWAAWFVGYTPSLATAVWMGHADGLAPLVNINGVPRVTGGTHPARAFSRFMTAALADRPAESFVVPTPIVSPTVTVSRPQYAETVVSARSTPTRVTGDCGGPCEYDAMPPPDLSVTPPPVVTPSTASPERPETPEETVPIVPDGPGTTAPTSPSSSNGADE